MDAIGLIVQLLLKNGILLLPLVTGWLAFRRLSRSRTSNAWIYAVFCLFSAVIVAGLLPWTLGFEAPSMVFFLLAAGSPALWYGVMSICDGPRRTSYETDLVDSLPIIRKRETPKPPPLLLSNPIQMKPAVPVFRHAPRAEPVAPEPESTEIKAPAPEIKQETSDTPRSVLEIARAMRRNSSSQPRRPKLLPSPENIPDLPFIRTDAS